MLFRSDRSGDQYDTECGLFYENGYPNLHANEGAGGFRKSMSDRNSGSATEVAGTGMLHHFESVIGTFFGTADPAASKWSGNVSLGGDCYG